MKDVGECCRSTELLSGSTVVEQNRAHKCCCRSMRSALPCGSNIPNLQDLVRIAVEFPCCFWMRMKLSLLSINPRASSRMRMKLSLLSINPRASSRSDDRSCRVTREVAEKAAAELTAAKKASTNEENVGDEEAVGDEEVVGNEEEIDAFTRPNRSHKPSCPVMPPFLSK
ncbi:hypothetical protein F2Q69_00059110 [Brassica cretica]|uniref:Uncharacterized protein n=1 Tax=Brassica cretica TaxID=69181 RepID=A0A8S9RHJ4_BRACR|nr:hypothetical protein F2Q69_00059110 [Brassica cretica]